MNFAPPVVKLNDLISGTVVTMDEWIKNEIYRLQNNIKPRHCQNYSELAEMLHEDPGRFQYHHHHHHHHHYHHHLPLPPLTEDFIHSSSSSDDDEEDDYQEEEDHGDGDGDKDEDEDEDEEDQDEQGEQEQETEQQNTPLNPLTPAPPPSWLCRVFVELMRYCDRITIKDDAPKLLLYEFEQLQVDMKLGKSILVDEFRDKLLKILFGQIQMTEYLVQVWKLMCEWVTKPPLHTHQNATRWLDLSLSAYLAARQLFIVGQNEK
ncbi:hypothetical protein BD408DRAFT_422666 [Parasitella parasitica]|nr:hypothetical protein BD408DRAFT_422666 [Parasitella parasitica]